MESKGIVFGLDFEQYLKHPGLSKSKLSAFASLGDQDREGTPAMEFGSLTHCAVLEPDKLEERYFWTSARRNSTAWMLAEKEAEGRTIVKDSDWFAATDMAESIHAHDEAMSIIRGAQKESSVFWIDEDTGIECKARPDIFCAELADLKTCVSAIKPAFLKDSYQFRYDWQDAHYLNGLAANGVTRDRMIFIAVEKTPKLLLGQSKKRHQIGLFEIGAMDRQRARDELREFMRIYAYCKRRGDWPGYPTGIQIMEKPSWMIRKDEESL